MIKSILMVIPLLIAFGMVHLEKTNGETPEEITFKRAVKKNEEEHDRYVAEILILVDKKVKDMYQKFGYSGDKLMETLRGDVNFFLSEVNNIYKSLEKNKVKLEIRIKDILYKDEDVLTPRDGQRLNGRIGRGIPLLNRLVDWMDTTGNFEKYKPDATILLTGYSIYRNLKGIAYIGDICTKKSVGIAHFKGTHTDVITIAHELGHILGAQHDDSEGIMTTHIQATIDNRWMFSFLSSLYINNEIKKLIKEGNNCLAETTTKSPMTYDLSTQLGRDIMDPEKICVRFKETSNTFLVKPRGGDKLCQRIYCAEKKSIDIRRKSQMRITVPSEGTVCGVGKRCQKGKCIAAPINMPTPDKFNNALNDKCVYGSIEIDDIYNNGVGRCNATRYTGYHQYYYCGRLEYKESCCEQCARRNGR